MSRFPPGRSLTWIELAVFVALIVAGNLLAPPASRALVEAAILVPIAVYNAWVSRGRWSYAFVGISLVLLAMAATVPLHVPAGPPPD